ncbi:MAG: SpaH/EbpB family LPXTG-anchored major pilin, partial [Ruminiclostridium sp.]|nr:SpaH/EbpB family LPXTG-anchored major pilin [Ruminiclostridium sp.]
LCSLDTTNPSVEIEEKNEVPSLTKVVQEDSTEHWGETNDADMGQVVNFKATITAFPGAQNYVMHDKMSAGLTFDADSVSIAGLTEGTHYTVKTSDICSGCDFHIVFEQSYLDTIEDQTSIVVTYTASLNNGAVIAGSGNPNDARLSYGESHTDWVRTTTYTWDMNVLKYANNDENKVLAGAVFKLLNKAKTQAAKIENGKFVQWVDVGSGTQLTTDAQGKIAIAGLDGDTYYLHETQAPAGYNLLTDDVEVKITGKTGNTYTTVLAKVNNNSGAELPSTGGMGTTLFYVLGGVLVLGAGVALVTKKRMA